MSDYLVIKTGYFSDGTTDTIDVPGESVITPSIVREAIDELVTKHTESVIVCPATNINYRDYLVSIRLDLYETEPLGDGDYDLSPLPVDSTELEILGSNGKTITHQLVDIASVLDSMVIDSEPVREYLSR